MTYLSAAYTQSTTTRRERIERLVRERTLDLRKKDDQLRQSQEMRAKGIRIAHEETIHRLVTASLCRDEETGMHIKRTGLISESLARAAGGGTGVAHLLRRVADTQSQTAFDRRTRLTNLKNAFALAAGASITPAQHYILIDDVFTTGSTLNSCAHALRREGCLNLDVVTFGHG